MDLLTGEALAKHFDGCRPFGVPDFLVPLLQSVRLEESERERERGTGEGLDAKSAAGSVNESVSHSNVLNVGHLSCGPMQIPSVGRSEPFGRYADRHGAEALSWRQTISSTVPPATAATKKIKNL